MMFLTSSLMTDCHEFLDSQSQFRGFCLLHPVALNTLLSLINFAGLKHSVFKSSN